MSGKIKWKIEQSMQNSKNLSLSHFIDHAVKGRYAFPIALQIEILANKCRGTNVELCPYPWHFEGAGGWVLFDCLELELRMVEDLHGVYWFFGFSCFVWCLWVGFWIA